MHVRLSMDETSLVELPWIRRLRRARPALTPPALRLDLRAVAQPECPWARAPAPTPLRAWVDRAVADLRGRAVVEPTTAALFSDPEAASQLASVGICESEAFHHAYLQALRIDVPEALQQALTGLPARQS